MSNYLSHISNQYRIRLNLRDFVWSNKPEKMFSQGKGVPLFRLYVSNCFCFFLVPNKPINFQLCLLAFYLTIIPTAQTTHGVSYNWHRFMDTTLSWYRNIRQVMSAYLWDVGTRMLLMWTLALLKLCQFADFFRMSILTMHKLFVPMIHVAVTFKIKKT